MFEATHLVRQAVEAELDDAAKPEATRPGTSRELILFMIGGVVVVLGALCVLTCVQLATMWCC